MGVVLWNQVNFTDLDLTLSSDVYSGKVLADPTITVKYEIGSAGTVKIVIKDLPVTIQDRIAAGLSGAQAKDGLKVEVKLGYLDEPWNRTIVFEGRIESMEAGGGNVPFGSYLPTTVILSGTEAAAIKLQAATNIDKDDHPPKKAALTLTDLTADSAVKKVLDAAALTVTGKVDWVPGEGESTAPTRTKNLSGDNAFVLLNKVAEVFNAEALVQDGKVVFGSNLKYPPDAGPLPSPPPSPSAVAAFLTAEDTLLALNSGKGMVAAQLVEFKPFQIGGGAKKKAVSERPPAGDVKGFDFTSTGAPQLRAGQLVIASIIGYQNPFSPFRILSITHTYSPDTGYTCAGRAVAFVESGKSNRGQSELARKASPLSVADKVAGKVKDAQTATSPVIDVGRVSATKAADHVVSVQYGQDSSGLVDTPSVDLDIKQKPDGTKLLDKPVVSPFAWHQVGLTLPAYVGMRAVLNQVRGSRDDTVISGYLWSNEPKMERPPAKDGDWWLCLPMELSTDSQLPTGKSVNDLTTADGRRVVEAAGLKIAVGKDACTKLGKRPTEGDADVLLITHKSGTTVQIDAAGNVTVDGKQQQIVLSAGGVTMTVGGGKVAIT